MKAGQFLFLLRRFGEFDPKINVLSGSDKRKENELFVFNKQKYENCTKITSTAKSANEKQQSNSKINKDFSTCRTLQ